MRAAPQFLRQDVRVEPLVNGFRAWPHLLPPQNLACNVVHKHLPALAGAATRPEYGELRTRYEDGAAGLVELGGQIAALDALLLAEADGRSLESFYPRVPGMLRGLVELRYDRFNQPGVRFLETALYSSRHFDTSLQQVQVQLVDPDLPARGMREARVERADAPVADIPFTDPFWDIVGAARYRGGSAAAVADALGVDPGVVGPWFGPIPDPLLEVGPVPGARVRFFGHACVLVESARTTVLLDPLVALRRPGGTDRFSFVDLPERLDVVAITHAHLDHFDIETLLQLRHRIGTVVVPRVGAGELVDPSLRLMLRALGFPDVVELDAFESLALPDGELLAVPFLGEHSDLDIAGKSGYALHLAGATTLFVADARCLEPALYEPVRERYGDVDALFAGMECEGSPMTTANGPYLALGRHTREMAEERRTKASDAESVRRLVGAVGARRVFVYAMGLEPWLTYMFGVPDPTKTESLEQVAELFSDLDRQDVPAQLLRGPAVIPLA